jgi:hypothetical protein
VADQLLELLQAHAAGDTLGGWLAHDDVVAIIAALEDRDRWQTRAESAASLYETAIQERDAALEDRDRLREGCQQALEAIAPCVVGWDYPDVPPMPEWAKRLESVVPILRAALEEKPS